ncbi:hypothetical protein BJX61DRAFT_382554 [Aspergillus egyptiacus]|nr:hypothetical protein BJX61DRAFT_382554 [Aspergillus egyptiacus]
MQELTPRAANLVRRKVNQWLPSCCACKERTNVISKRLNDIYLTVEASDKAFLDESDLAQLGIKLSPLSREADAEEENTTTFFRPLPTTEVGEINWNDVWPPHRLPDGSESSQISNAKDDSDKGLSDSEHSEQDTSDDGNDDGDEEIMPRSSRPNAREIAFGVFKVRQQVWGRLLLAHKESPWNRIDFSLFWPRVPKVTTGSWPRHPYDWNAYYEFEIPSILFPHMICKLQNDTEPDERISHGEVLTIAAYMEWRLRNLKYSVDYYVPMLVLSFFNSKARILQASHDGKQLRIDMSELYDMKPTNRDNYEELARWLFSTPCGKTREPIDIKGEKLDDRTVATVRSRLVRAFISMAHQESRRTQDV